MGSFTTLFKVQPRLNSTTLPWSRNSLYVGSLLDGAFCLPNTLSAKWYQERVPSLFLVPAYRAHVLREVANYLMFGVMRACKGSQEIDGL